MICLADDSGLEIDILDKAPGIYSSRWRGKNNNFNKAISRVFKKINEKDKNWRQKKIKARFICALTIYWPNGKSVNSIGKVEGHISAKKKGNNGFGYDPIFMDYKTDQSAAELPPELKNRISHRGQALQKLKQKLKILYDEKR